MAAVPHFDMKPGERLKALREVPVNVENLLEQRLASPIDGPEVLLSVRGLTKTFTTRSSGWFGKGTGTRFVPSTASVSTSGAVNAWGW